MHGERVTGAARRRRERRLKHERQTVRMVLAETFHHSSAPFPPKFKEKLVERHEQHAALRGQKTARTREATHCTSKTGVAGEAVFFELYDEDTAGRPASLAEPLGPVCKPARGTGSWCFDGPDVTMPLVMEEEEVAVPLLVFQEPVIDQELPEVLVTSSLVRAAQPADVEQVLDVPVLHMIENDNKLYEFLDLASFQEIPEIQVVDAHVPPGPVSANFVELVVEVPGRVPLGPVSEGIVEQVVDAPVRGQVPQDTLSGGIVEQVVGVHTVYS